MLTLKEINARKSQLQKEGFEDWRDNHGARGIFEWACVLGDTEVIVRKISKEGSHRVRRKKCKRQRRTINPTTPAIVLYILKRKYLYDKEIGTIANRKKGKVHSTLTSEGYLTALTVTVNQVEYVMKPHRYAWYITTDIILEENEQIDHKNRIKNDNRFSNLRIANNSINQQNSISRTGKYKGVSKEERGYRVSISIGSRVKRERYRIGFFRTEEDAAKYADSIYRYYSPEGFLTNFKEKFIPSLSIHELRLYKRRYYDEEKD